MNLARSAFLLAVLLIPGAAAAQTADLILVNGSVVTVDEHRPSTQDILTIPAQ